jgi:hypothetical protein
MYIKDYETEIGGQSPVRAVELLEKKDITSCYRNCYSRNFNIQKDFLMQNYRMCNYVYDSTKYHMPNFRIFIS